jgi:hypothetical protein
MPSAARLPIEGIECEQRSRAPEVVRASKAGKAAVASVGYPLQ